MAVYRSAMGKKVDMSALSATNERVRAVGNGKMNARGDVVDSEGRVVKPSTTKINEIYARTVTNRGATTQPPPPTQAHPPQKLVTDDQLSTLHQAELELNEDGGHDLEVERIKAAETKRGRK